MSVSDPGDVRNDLYLTLERGDFERGGKSVQKNIEVTMYVLYADGEILKVQTSAHLCYPACTGPNSGLDDGMIHLRLSFCQDFLW